MAESKRFSCHDTTIIIWSDVATDWRLYDRLKRLMRRQGFSWGPDPRIKKQYPSLASTYHYGRHGDLEFDAKINPAYMSLEFYQNLVFENPNGGKYDFNKAARMPFLFGVRFRKTMAALVAKLKAEGFADVSAVRPKSASAFVAARRAETGAFHRGIYERPIAAHDSRDADGAMLKDGDLRWYRDPKGHLWRGTVFYALGNTWWVVCNESRWDKVHSGGLFSWRSGMARKAHPRPRRPEPTVESLQARVAKLEASRERLRARLRRMQKAAC